MTRLISIDPGVAACGIADFHGETLVRAGYYKPHEWAGALAGERAVVVIEFPRIYPAARQKGDQNDLLQLARYCGRLEQMAHAAHYGVEFVEPRQWKGTLDPDAMVQRIINRLRPGELDGVRLPTAASRQHNVWDAIGVGLHALGRLEPRRVIAR